MPKSLDRLIQAWPAVTGFVCSAVIVARATGYLTNLTDDAANNLMLATGTVLATLAGRSAVLGHANATAIATAANAAVSNANAASNTAAVLAAQAIPALQESSRQVLQAAAAQPTTSVIVAAANAAEKLNEVAKSTQQQMEGLVNDWR
jgi:hypothetical protein